MKMMIKQLLLGFELELYIECDYPYILFYLDYMCGALDNNNRNYITKYDKEFLLGKIKYLIFLLSIISLANKN